MNREDFYVIKFLSGTTKLNLFSVHLSTNESERILSAKELIRITSRIAKNEAIIIAGDFNAGIKKIGKHKYIYEPKDSYEEYELLKSKFNCLGNTENTWFSKESNACIDTCFFSKNLKLLKYETIKTDVSDHYPIYMEFII